ncbi:MAG: helix-turn-helix transcriptional regulator [Clostridia bacterium]|nr:helix-turn-helix transcriptional regulator [Clostridia bacterium]MBQ7117511.1 helix-turn-helix transcriptional regulator [Clostridia bacterium]
MTSKECGIFIAELRKENKLTQKELAEKINVSDKAVSRWETGKGYPDVASLVSLSEYFGVSVNELLAGKKLTDENIKETADENLISVFEQVQNNRKQQNFKVAVYTSVMLVVLLPVLVIIGKELFVSTVTQIQPENLISAIISAVVGIVLLIVGILIRKGNVSLLHSYHYKNVTDMDAYAKELGSAVMFICIPAFINGFMTLFVHIKIVSVISSVLFFTGMIICVIHIFKVQTKHNGSLF